MVNTGSEIICVDLDGTLVQTDTLYELFILALKQNLLLIFLVPLWLLKGKAHFKARLSARMELRPETLLYNESVLDYINQKRASSASVYLVSASNQRVIDSIATYLGVFNGAYGSDETRNLKGMAKTEFLNSTFGEKNYTYIGNDNHDLHVWESSASAVVVSNSNRLIDKVRQINKDVHVLPAPYKAGVKSYLRLMRPHQWVKNVLIFVPLILSHLVFDADKVFTAAFGFVLFSLAASGIYVFNDLLDISNDRMHPTKSKRPLASGELPVINGAILGIVLWSVSLSLSFIFFEYLFLLIVAYIAANFLYSLLLKRLVLIDAFALAGFYIARIIIGAIITKVSLSFWLVTFSLFAFFSLALVKRYIEITLFTGDADNLKGRGYNKEDELITTILGVTSGLIAVLVLALYIHDENTRSMYSHLDWLWIPIPALLYWISRVWLLAHRRVLADDPISFAIKDKMSYFVLIVILFSVYMAI